MTRSSGPRRAVGLWLLTCFVLVLGLVLIGGLTRLTGSGLSIVEWKPVTGIVPPLSDADWERELNLYRTSPEYKLVNAGMSMKAFQRIYWFEYVHRLWGRLVGFALLGPLLWLAIRRRVGRPLFLRVIGLVLLGAGQGAIGWYMVKSGLDQTPSVSAVRLTLHLTMALALCGLLLSTALDELRGRPETPRRLPGARSAVALCLFGLITVASGGLVAGTHAGLNYNTFPLMAGKLVPPGLLVLQPAWRNMLENILTVQFQHRVLALSLSFAALAFALHVLWHRPRALRPAATTVALLAIAQPTLGVLTLLYYVPLTLAALHQMGGFLLFSSLVWLTHALRHPKQEASQPATAAATRSASTVALTSCARTM